MTRGDHTVGDDAAGDGLSRSPEKITMVLFIPVLALITTCRGRLSEFRHDLTVFGIDRKQAVACRFCPGFNIAGETKIGGWTVTISPSSTFNLLYSFKIGPGHCSPQASTMNS